jgi:hypothetical protein
MNPPDDRFVLGGTQPSGQSNADQIEAPPTEAPGSSSADSTPGGQEGIPASAPAYSTWPGAISPSASEGWPESPAAPSSLPPGTPASEWTPPPPFPEPAPDGWAAPAAPSSGSRWQPTEWQIRNNPERILPTGRLAVVAQLLIGLCGALALYVAIQQIAGIDMQRRINNGTVLIDEVDSFNSMIAGLTLLALGLQLVSGIVFMRWQWQSMRNATLLDAGHSLIGSPRSAVIAWFIPLANLVRPYQYVSELHDRLLFPLQSTSGRWLIRLWWVFWIAGDIAGWLVRFGLAPSIKTGSTTGRLELMAGLAVCEGLLVADAILAIAVIRQIQRLSDARLVARQGHPGTAVNLVVRSQRQRVTRVPLALAAAAIVALCVPTGLIYTKAGAAPEWVQYLAPDGSFTVLLPGQPLEKPIPMSTVNNMSLSGDTFRCGTNANLIFIITYYDYPPGTIEGISPSKAYANMDASLSAEYDLTSQTDVTISGLPGHDVRASGTSGSLQIEIRARYLIVGRRVYVIEADATPEQAASPDIARFLDSFAVNL